LSLFDWIFWPTVEDWRKEIEMWTDKDREKYKADGRRYPSDLTDAEWDIIKPLKDPLIYYFDMLGKCFGTRQACA
jgi:hypothetical protein